ncbi:hypothetical protein Emed_004858 [Eimeria media]
MAPSAPSFKQQGEHYGRPAARTSVPLSSTPGHSAEALAELSPAAALGDKRSKGSRGHFPFRIFGGVLVAALVALLAYNLSRKLLRTPAPASQHEELVPERKPSSEAQSAVDEIVAWVASSKGPEEEVDWHALLREELLTKPGFPDIRKYVSENGRLNADFVHEDLNHLTPSWDGPAAADELATKLLPEVEAAVEDFHESSLPVCQRSVRFGESLGGAGLATITVRRPPRRNSDLDVESVGLDPKIAARYAEWRQSQKHKKTQEKNDAKQES